MHNLFAIAKCRVLYPLQAGNHGVNGITSGISIRAPVSVDTEYVVTSLLCQQFHDVLLTKFGVKLQNDF